MVVSCTISMVVSCTMVASCTTRTASPARRTLAPSMPWQSEVTIVIINTIVTIVH